MMMPRNLVEMAVLLVAGLALAVAVLGDSYVPALAAVMVVLLAWVLVSFLHWRRSVRESHALAPTAGAGGSGTTKLD
jgi:hypothetical protein